MTWLIVMNDLRETVKCTVNSGPNLRILKTAMVISEASYLDGVSLAEPSSVSLRSSYYLHLR